MVKFLNYRELRNTPSAVWEALQSDDAVAIVSNGQPRALMLEIENGDVNGALELVRRIRAQMALAKLRSGAQRDGTDQLDGEEIEAEVHRARSERSRKRGRSAGRTRRG